MKTRHNHTMTPLDHMIVSAGGHTVSELERQAVRAVEDAPMRRACRAVAKTLAAAADWFAARAEVVRDR